MTRFLAPLLLLATPAVASGLDDERDMGGLIRSDFSLPLAEQDDDADRFLLPDIAETYERREPPRLRWRGRKVKLRVPIG